MIDVYYFVYHMKRIQNEQFIQKKHPFCSPYFVKISSSVIPPEPGGVYIVFQYF